MKNTIASTIGKYIGLLVVIALGMAATAGFILAAKFLKYAIMK